MTIGIGVGFGGVEVGCEVPFIVELGGTGTEEGIDVWLTARGGFDVGATAGGGFEAGLTIGAFETSVVGTRVEFRL